MTARQKKKKILLKENKKITKNMKTPTANTANTTPSGKDSAPPSKDTLLRLLLKEKKKKCTSIKTMSKKTKTTTNMNKKTTVARIPVLGLLVVVLVVNIIPVIVLSDPLVRQVPSLAHTEPQSHICWSQIMTQMRRKIMWIYPSPLAAKTQMRSQMITNQIKIMIIISDTATSCHHIVM